MNREPVLSMWIVNDILYLQTKHGLHELKNPYISDIKFGDLESEPNELITMVGNNKFWSKAELVACSGVQ